MKALWDAIWNRVVVNWLPTLLGIVWAVAVVVSDQVIAWSAGLGLPSWASGLIAAAGAAFGAYARSKAKPAP